jgi:hypothetical protein
MWEALKNLLFGYRLRKRKFSGDEGVIEMRDKLCQWRAEGWRPPAALEERPSRGVVDAELLIKSIIEGR